MRLNESGDPLPEAWDLQRQREAPRMLCSTNIVTSIAPFGELTRGSPELAVGPHPAGADLQVRIGVV